MAKNLTVSICGAGAWGTALALQCARQDVSVTLIPRRDEQVRALKELRENQTYLPGCPLPKTVKINGLDEAKLEESQVVFFAAPSYALRSWLERIRGSITAERDVFLVSLAKGLELASGKTPCSLIGEFFPETNVGSLSGPTYAMEVAIGKPSALTLGATRIQPIVELTQEAISGPNMRIYLSDDLKGVELGGCLKNVYAIAAGCCQGLRLGDNALAALLTRALAEMVRVGVALGAKAETFYGLSGFGDLVATCHGTWSRNRTFGEAVAMGETAEAIIANQKTAVEGYRTAKSFRNALASERIEAPILEQVYQILYENKPPLKALNDLMSRDLKRETD